MIKLLEGILLEKNNREKLIYQFQEKIWDGDYDFNDEIMKILHEIAYDLSYYEPDEFLRQKDKSYFGEDRLELEIKTAIEELKLKGFTENEL